MQVLFIIIGILLFLFILLWIIALFKQPRSVYKKRPEAHNPMEGQRVEFVYNEADPANSDGVKGHLKAVGKSEKRRGIYETKIKRLLDIILSFFGLIILMPVYIAIALAIYIDDPGPIFFSQKRVGQDKRYFVLHKFRSMKVFTPDDVPTHRLENPDKYITRVGKFIRKHSLDELPQLWDIFMGNMSVIGPRPALWNQDLLTAERDKYHANDVKPGLTGWAQINGRDTLEIPEKAKLDGDYVKNVSFVMDCRCFFGSLHVFKNDSSVVEGGTGEINKKK